MTNEPKNLKPRNGFLLVRMIRPEQSIIRPETAKPLLEPDINILIVAVAPDCPSEPRSNVPAFRVGDSIITSPSNFAPIDNDFAFVHHSAVMAIERD